MWSGATLNAAAGRAPRLAAALVATLLVIAAYQQGSRAGMSARQMRPPRNAAAVSGARVPLPPPLPLPLLHAFAAATATADFRHDLVKAMRGWRRGIRTLVLTNATGDLLAREQEEGRLHNEVWQHYPDVPGISTGKPGDARAAVTPALARSALGSGFRWLIYGDDDVAFFWPGLLRALQGLDHRDPYLLTDNYFGLWPDGAPVQRKPDQPRCIPCTLNDTGLDLAAANVLKTCSCSVAAMAQAFAEPLASMRRFPSQPPVFSINGGGGAILSAGLLERLGRRRFQDCVSGHGRPVNCAGSDCLLTTCMWRQGLGYTDPGFQLRHRGLLQFDAYERQLWRAHRDMLTFLADRGGCDATCQLRVRHAVSLHANGKVMQQNVTYGAGRVAAFLCAAAAAARRVAAVELAASDAGV